MVCLTETELTAALLVAAALGRPAGRVVLASMGKVRDRTRLVSDEDAQSGTPEMPKK